MSFIRDRSNKSAAAFNNKPNLADASRNRNLQKTPQLTHTRFDRNNSRCEDQEPPFDIDQKNNTIDLDSGMIVSDPSMNLIKEKRTLLKSANTTTTVKRRRNDEYAEVAPIRPDLADDHGPKSRTTRFSIGGQYYNLIKMGIKTIKPQNKQIYKLK